MRLFVVCHFACSTDTANAFGRVPIRFFTTCIDADARRQHVQERASTRAICSGQTPHAREDYDQDKHLMNVAGAVFAVFAGFAGPDHPLGSVLDHRSSSTKLRMYSVQLLVAEFTTSIQSRRRTGCAVAPGACL